MVNALRERLFAFTAHIALDLASLNMQRSRDHAIPGKYSGLIHAHQILEPFNLNHVKSTQLHAALSLHVFLREDLPGIHFLFLIRLQCMATVLWTVCTSE